MSQVTIFHKSQLLTAATAISATAALTIPATAHARPFVPLAPACAQYGFPGDVVIREVTGWNVAFSATGPVVNGRATATKAGAPTKSGSIKGFIDANRNVQLDVWYDGNGDGEQRYLGVVGTDGKGHGKTASQLRAQDGIAWDTVFPLSCTDAPAQAPPAQAPPAQTPVKPMATVVGGDVDVYPLPNTNNDQTRQGILGVGSTVELVGNCQPEDWCQVKGAAVPGGQGFIWGHLQLP